MSELLVTDLAGGKDKTKGVYVSFKWSFVSGQSPCGETCLTSSAAIFFSGEEGGCFSVKSYSRSPVSDTCYIVIITTTVLCPAS